MIPRISWAFVSLGLSTATGLSNWPMLHGNAQHDGYRQTVLDSDYHLGWAREFEDDRLGTAMEPIVDASGVYIATHRGYVYALDPFTGDVHWQFAAPSPFLHSPALQADLLVAASADGSLYGLDTATGLLRWHTRAAHAGFSASPVLTASTGYIGDRLGNFIAFRLQDGGSIWTCQFAAPIRQTAAITAARVIVTAEDLRVRCLDTQTGRSIWTSDPLAGQSARDYYPVILSVGERTFVIIRTNPALNMARRIALDRSLLAQHAGADDRDWRRLDAWIKSPAAHGTPELWTSEQAAIRNHLAKDPSAMTFFVLDAATGQPAAIAPVLWVGGCQGIGVMPARTSDNRLLILHRTAYGNWNHGVAPLVGLGKLDLPSGACTPLFHTSGPQPPWNTFWGTADEAQNLVVAGTSALMVHQGTLSRYDFDSGKLRRLAGNRDTFGGFPSTRWARNEWHGPARGGVALANANLYWLTGSRVLCLRPGRGPDAQVAITPSQGTPASDLSKATTARWGNIRHRLERAVDELLRHTWAPLAMEPGLAGRQFFFDHSGDLFESLAWAYPHLPPHLQERARAQLSQAWETHPPWTAAMEIPLHEGVAREWHPVPGELRKHSDNPSRFHPFGNLGVAWFYARRCNEQPRLLQAWPQIVECHTDFLNTAWKLNPERGHLWANRYAASWIALSEVARLVEEPELSRIARQHADATLDALATWWQRAADEGREITRLHSVADLDPFIGQGGALSLRLAPHHHRIGLFQDLTPEVADGLHARTGFPAAFRSVEATFQRLQPTWWLVGEERQVHYGENFLDPPDHAYHAFRSLAFLSQRNDPDNLLGKVDLPFCRADLYHIAKLAIALDAASSARATVRVPGRH